METNFWTPKKYPISHITKKLESVIVFVKRIVLLQYLVKEILWGKISALLLHTIAKNIPLVLIKENLFSLILVQTM